jgi:toxin ParE1/3/4
MNRISIVRSPASKKDLVYIWQWIALENSAAADKVLNSISNRILQLAEFPNLGRPRPDILGDARALTVGNYLVLYRFADGTITIVRVVHGARDLKAIF